MAERERTSPPTTARQLETDAISPMRKAVIGVIVPPIPRFRIPDFCRKKKTIRKTRPIGRACQKTSLSLFFHSIFSFETIYPWDWSVVVSSLASTYSSLFSVVRVRVSVFISTLASWISESSERISSIRILQEGQCVPEI